jgi:hypothetical protein
MAAICAAPAAAPARSRQTARNRCLEQRRRAPAADELHASADARLAPAALLHRRKGRSDALTARIHATGHFGFRGAGSEGLLLSPSERACRGPRNGRPPRKTRGRPRQRRARPAFRGAASVSAQGMGELPSTTGSHRTAQSLHQTLRPRGTPNALHTPHVVTRQTSALGTRRGRRGVRRRERRFQPRLVAAWLARRSQLG